MERKYWVDAMLRIARPVVEAAAAGELKSRMPVVLSPDSPPNRKNFAHLEAIARTLMGIAPWLELEDISDPDEAQAQAAMRVAAREAFRRITDTTSETCLDFDAGPQCLVDTSLLAHTVLRAPRTMWDELDESTQDQVATAFRRVRQYLPGFNNWLLFSALIEAALYKTGNDWDVMRLDYAFRQHDQWYLGDGLYSDGPEFHFDYYNSLVIHSKLLDILDLVAGEKRQWQMLHEKMIPRARRYGAILERMISPEGTYPPVGRSLAYRFGVFHLLSLLALRDMLPEGVTPAQVRCGLGAVIRRTLAAPGTFTDDGWLTIGIAGHQPHIGEGYINSGSVYTCACVFLPLGLPAEHLFWSAPDTPWTAKRIWAGEDVVRDHAIRNG